MTLEKKLSGFKRTLAVSALALSSFFGTPIPPASAEVELFPKAASVGASVNTADYERNPHRVGDVLYFDREPAGSGELQIMRAHQRINPTTQKLEWRDVEPFVEIDQEMFHEEEITFSPDGEDMVYTSRPLAPRDDARLMLKNGEGSRSLDEVESLGRIWDRSASLFDNGLGLAWARDGDGVYEANRQNRLLNTPFENIQRRNEFDVLAVTGAVSSFTYSQDGLSAILSILSAQGPLSRGVAEPLPSLDFLYVTRPIIGDVFNIENGVWLNRPDHLFDINSNCVEDGPSFFGNGIDQFYFHSNSTFRVGAKGGDDIFVVSPECLPDAVPEVSPSGAPIPLGIYKTGNGIAVSFGELSSVECETHYVLNIGQVTDLSNSPWTLDWRVQEDGVPGGIGQRIIEVSDTHPGLISGVPQYFLITSISNGIEGTAGYMEIVRPDGTFQQIARPPMVFDQGNTEFGFPLGHDINLDITDMVMINTPDNEYAPTFSEDGRRFFFTTENLGSNVAQIMVADVYHTAQEIQNVRPFLGGNNRQEYLDLSSNDQYMLWTDRSNSPGSERRTEMILGYLPTTDSFPSTRFLEEFQKYASGEARTVQETKTQLFNNAMGLMAEEYCDPAWGATRCNPETDNGIKEYARPDALLATPFDVSSPLYHPVPPGTTITGYKVSEDGKTLLFSADNGSGAMLYENTRPDLNTPFAFSTDPTLLFRTTTGDSILGKSPTKNLALAYTVSGAGSDINIAWPMQFMR